MSGNLRAYLAEAIGTFALVFIGAGAVCMDVLSGGTVGLLGIAIAHGLVIMVMISIYIRASGAHFNPAVTIAMLITNRIDSVKAVFYIISQLFGAALGAVMLAAVLPPTPDLIAEAPYMGALSLSGIDFQAGTLVEAIATFFLVTAIFATAVDPKGPTAFAPTVIGMTVLVGCLAAAPLTGAALNPARAFGPAVVTGRWAHWYVYWIGPIAGSITAALLYEKIFMERRR